MTMCVPVCPKMLIIPRRRKGMDTPGLRLVVKATYPA